MIKTARQASATLPLRRNFGEGHNKPKSGCRLYAGGTTPSRGPSPADRDQTQRPRCCFRGVHAIFPPKLKIVSAATRDNTSAAISVAISRSRWEYPRTTIGSTTVVTFGGGRLAMPRPDVASNQPPAGCEDLGPAQNANRVPQSGRPKWICLHERVDHVWTVGFNDPQPTGGIA